MSLSALRKMSEEFNSELQEIRMKLYEEKEKKQSKIEEIRKLFGKEIKEIEESGDSLEQENEKLTNEILNRQNDIKNLREVCQYENENQIKLESDKENIISLSKKEIKTLNEIEKKKCDMLKIEINDDQKNINEINEKYHEKFSIYEQLFGLKLEKIDNNLLKIEFTFGFGEKSIVELKYQQENSYFLIKKINPLIEITEELEFLNRNYNMSIFLTRIRSKFLQAFNK